VAETIEEERPLVVTDVAARPEAENGADKKQSSEEALVDALRKFVWHETQEPGKPADNQEPGKIGVFQAIVLLVVVLDIVLLYSEFQDWFDNPLFKFALQVLPWLLGATAFAYSDHLREWILEQCKHKLVAFIAVFIALPLLIVRQPIFSVIASATSDSISVNAESQGDKLTLTMLDPKRVRITVPDLLRSYKIVVKDTDESKHPVDFPQHLSRWRVVKGTVAQLPLIGRLFGGSTMQLLPLYMVMTSSEKEGSAIIEGQFDREFLRQVSSLSKSRCTEAPSTSTGLEAIRCQIPNRYDAFPLPAGKYTFRLYRSGCDNSTTSERRVPEDGAKIITLDELCSN